MKSKKNTKLRFYYETEDDKVELNEEIFIDRDENDEMDILLNEFKRFLVVVGYHDITISHIQNLEDDEWRDVLIKYHDWDEVKEKSYQSRKEILDKIK